MWKLLVGLVRPVLIASFMIADSWTWSDLFERPFLQWFLFGFQIWKYEGRPTHWIFLPSKIKRRFDPFTRVL